MSGSNAACRPLGDWVRSSCRPSGDFWSKNVTRPAASCLHFTSLCWDVNFFPPTSILGAGRRRLWRCSISFCILELFAVQVENFNSLPILCTTRVVISNETRFSVKWWKALWTEMTISKCQAPRVTLNQIAVQCIVMPTCSESKALTMILNSTWMK